MTDRELMQRVFEVFEEAVSYVGSPTWSPSMEEECLGVLQKLKAALAEAQPQQESVEWIEPTPDFYISELSRNTIRFHNAVHGRQEFSKKPLNECTVPVWFTLPPAQRKPLTMWTEAQHERSYRNSPELHNDVKSLAAFKRVAKEIAAMYGIN